MHGCSAVRSWHTSRTRYLAFLLSWHTSRTRQVLNWLTYLEHLPGTGIFLQLFSAFFKHQVKISIHYSFFSVIIPVQEKQVIVAKNGGDNYRTAYYRTAHFLWAARSKKSGTTTGTTGTAQQDSSTAQDSSQKNSCSDCKFLPG